MCSNYIVELFEADKSLDVESSRGCLANGGPAAAVVAVDCADASDDNNADDEPL